MKDRTEARERSRGLFNITVTPFGADGAIDEAALTASIERVLAFGYDGLLIGGIYGEFPTLSPAERASLFHRVMAVVGDRVPVLLCCAASDTRVVRELTGLASELGGLPMITAPYASEVTDDHLAAFFGAIAGLSRTGIMIYNAPGIGITLSPALIERLCDIAGVVALKQGDLAPTTVDLLANRVVGRIRVLAASDLAMLGPLAAGFDGVSSTNSCALPELIQATCRAMAEGDARRAGRLHRLWFPLRQLARRFGQPQTTKAMMAARGWFGGAVRPPLLDLDAAQRREVAAAMAALAAEPEAGIA